MNIGLDACGNFAARSITAGFESSALAATTVPPGARVDISGWTQQRLAAWGREELGELHAAELDWDQRREVCAMLGDRGDLHAAVIVTSNLLLCSEEAVTAHRARQTKLAEASVAAATTDDGHRRGQRVFRLLSGGRLGQSRLNDREYVLAAMVPQAVMYATQRAFCFTRATSGARQCVSCRCRWTTTRRRPSAMSRSRCSRSSAAMSGSGL